MCVEEQEIGEAYMGEDGCVSGGGGSGCSVEERVVDVWRRG